ncbi:MAG: DUF4878 domain-containing protein [Dehalococcoidia bacterium]|nr:DUF4878 domain-containing protein [Dehalococcoidia bacterium]
MKGWFKVALVLLLVALVGGMAAGCNGEASPEDTVRGLIKAMEAQDAEKAGQYVVEDTRNEFVAGMKMAFAFIDSMKISNLKLTVASQTENTATVVAEFDLEVKIMGETEKSRESDTLDLVKVDGKWLIIE